MNNIDVHNISTMNKILINLLLANSNKTIGIGSMLSEKSKNSRFSSLFEPLQF
jgi:hypothetical protein